jgi:hypothetical protein
MSLTGFDKRNFLIFLLKANILTSKCTIIHTDKPKYDYEPICFIIITYTLLDD